MSLILEQLHSAAENQFPTYAENAYKTAQRAERITLLNILELRVNEINSTTKKSRVEKLIKKITAAEEDNMNFIPRFPWLTNIIIV